MTRYIRAGALLVAAAVSTGCAFEQSRSLVAPSLGEGDVSPPLPSGGSGALTGSWNSEAPLTIPASWRCGNFQWNISEQTGSSLAGSFAAVCAGIVTVSGKGTGQLNGTQVALQISGTANLQNAISCPFTLTSNGQLEGDSVLRLPYSGQTCLGPVHGEEVLRRPAAAEPAPPPPPPPPLTPEPSPAGNPHHVGPGPLSFARAEQVVYATANEFPHLTAPHPTESQAISAAEELLLRTIWHLKVAGYDAARQRNPSGAISNDKLTILIEGQWHAYDIFYDYGRPNQQMRVIFYEVGSPNPIAYPGIAD